METISLSSEEFFRENEQIAITTSYYLPTIERHRHDFYEIVYVTRGSGYHILNDKRYFISEGSMLLITRGSIHGYYSEQNMQWVNIMFKPQAVNHSIINTDNAGNIITALLTSDLFQFNANAQHSSVNMIVNEMQYEYEAQQSGYQEILTGYLQVLLMMLFRTTIGQSERSGRGVNVKEDDLVETVIDLLSRGEDITPEVIARKAFISPRYFQNLFKKKSGESLTTFKRRYRIEQACRLLDETDMSVSKVMEAVNMNDAKNFYAAFRTFTGMTPREYRMKHKEEKK
jgi:AraC family L-rhamnose operon transcriptional activator RhaR